MSRRRYCYREVLPFTALVAAECSNVGTNILFKDSTLKGMSFYVYVAYLFLISTFVELPFLFFFHRSAILPPLNFPLISRICLLGVIGHEKRMERVEIKSSSFQAKIIGTIVSISGALVVLFYEGPEVFLSASSLLLQLQPNWIIGGFLLIVELILESIWYIVMAQVMKMYPAEWIVVFLYSICATIVAVPVCLIAEPNLNSWIMKPSLAAVAIFYSGIVEVFIDIVQTWSVHLKGPVYVAIFKPFSIVIAAVMSALFLGDALHLGIVIGAMLISIGFYAVIWGKAKEELIVDDDQRSPFLQRNKVVES